MVDLERLPEDVRRAARVIRHGQVEWPLEFAPEAVAALAQIGVVILDLELRTYDPDGSITDVAWSASNPGGLGNPVRDAREAVGALDRPALPGDWMLVTIAT